MRDPKTLQNGCCWHIRQVGMKMVVLNGLWESEKRRGRRRSPRASIQLETHDSLPSYVVGALFSPINITPLIECHNESSKNNRIRKHASNSPSLPLLILNNLVLQPRKNNSRRSIKSHKSCAYAIDLGRSPGCRLFDLRSKLWNAGVGGTKVSSVIAIETGS
jgi:hypothetical protein